MSLKIFTNAFKGNLTESIAINSDHVASVFEIPWVDDESGEETKAQAFLVYYKSNMVKSKTHTWRLWLLV
jgi:hypothetical protein